MTTQTQTDPSNFWLSLGALTAFTYALPHNAQKLSSLVSSTCGSIIQDSSISAPLACGGSRMICALYGASYAAMTAITVYELLKLLGYEETITSQAKTLSSYLFTYTK